MTTPTPVAASEERLKWAAEQFRQTQVLALNTSAAGAGLAVALIGSWQLWVKGDSPGPVATAALVALLLSAAASPPMHLFSARRYAEVIRKAAATGLDLTLFEWSKGARACGMVQLACGGIGTGLVVLSAVLR